MWTDIILLIVYGLITACGIWAFAHHDSYSRWFYLFHAMGFTALMVGIWPGAEDATAIGLVILMISAGLQTITRVIVDGFDKKGLDIRTGKRHSKPNGIVGQ